MKPVIFGLLLLGALSACGSSESPSDKCTDSCNRNLPTNVQCDMPQNDACVASCMAAVASVSSTCAVCIAQHSGVTGTYMTAGAACGFDYVSTYLISDPSMDCPNAAGPMTVAMCAYYTPAPTSLECMDACAGG